MPIEVEAGVGAEDGLRRFRGNAPDFVDPSKAAATPSSRATSGSPSGGLPPGVNDQGGVVLATAEVSGETFVLAQRSGAWRAIGPVRRSRDALRTLGGCGEMETRNRVATPGR
jgi:hypothetical protein